MTYVGLDLHKRRVTACALDASGTVVLESTSSPSRVATMCNSRIQNVWSS